MFVLVSLFMMLVVLIQKPKGGGLSGAFGGAGGGETSFVGARIGDFLTWLTVGCFLAFLLLAMLLTWNINPAENAIKAARTAPVGATTPGVGVDSEAITTEPAPEATDPPRMPPRPGRHARPEATPAPADPPTPASPCPATTTPRPSPSPSSDAHAPRLPPGLRPGPCAPLPGEAP